MEEKEIINVKSWMDFGDCNYEIDHDDDSIPDSGVVYCNIEHIHKFFRKCLDTSNKYIVVSGFSDYGFALQEEHSVAMDMKKWLPFIDQSIDDSIGYKPLTIPPRCNPETCFISDKYSIKCYAFTYSTVPDIPDNVVKWYLVNSMVNHEKITSIPLGVGKDAGKDICSTLSEPVRSFGLRNFEHIVYLNWQDNTIERANLKFQFKQMNPDWVTIVEEPKPYTEYLKDLSNHAFALCPKGNGVDCYRVLECIYAGCIPIIKDEPAYEYLRELPHLRVKNWSDLTPELLKSKLEEIKYKEYNLDMAHLSYWKRLIEDSRNLL